MPVAIAIDSVAALRSKARERAGATLPVRLGHYLVQLWLRHVERRIERAVLELDHSGVAEDYRRASPYPKTADFSALVSAAR